MMRLRYQPLIVSLFVAATCASAWAQALVRISVRADGSQGAFSSVAPLISGNGRYVAFLSESALTDDVVESGDFHLFVHDRVTGNLRVAPPAEGFSFEYRTRGGGINKNRIHFTPDGRLLLLFGFSSGGRRGSPALYTYELETREYDVVELEATAPARRRGRRPDGILDVTPDARFIAIAVDGETFIADRRERTLIPVESVVPDNSSVGLSGDARLVVFSSDESDLVPGDTNNSTDVFLWDRQSDDVIRISRVPSGLEANGDSHSPSITDDGRWVVFFSEADNLVDGARKGLYAYDRINDTLQILTDMNTVHHRSHRLSGDGRWLLLHSSGGHVRMELSVVGGRMVVMSSCVIVGAEGESVSVDEVSDDGSVWARETNAALVPTDTNNVADVYVSNTSLENCETAIIDLPGNNQATDHTNEAGLGVSGLTAGSAACGTVAIAMLTISVVGLVAARRRH